MGAFSERLLLDALILSSVLWIALSQTSFSRLGNAIIASSSSPSVEKVTFLLQSKVTSNCLLFGFSAYFRSTSKVRLQIWRPVMETTTELDMKLVYEVAVTPTVEEARQDIYIENELGGDSCFELQMGDRLGLFIEEAPGAVAYVFREMNPVPQKNQPEDREDPHVIGDIVTFDELMFPYAFSVAAHTVMDVDIMASGNGDLVQCPPCLLIPRYSDDQVSRTVTIPASCSAVDPDPSECPELQCQKRNIPCKSGTRSRSCGLY